MKYILYFISTLLTISIIMAEYKNVQVLEFESARDLKIYMKSISKDLGVKCSFCHDLDDKSIETEHKTIAREMIKMQIQLNQDYFSHIGDSLSKLNNFSPITCWTCHRGSKKPQLFRTQ